MNRTLFTTKRLCLEKIRSAHKRDLFRLLANPVVHRHFPNALDKKEAQTFYDRIQHRYTRDGYCFWAVLRKRDGIFLGICGLVLQTIDGVREVEVGYRFSNEFWGRGYGTEAANGCIRYARDVLGAPSVISLIRPANRPSIRVAEKNGLRFERETLFHGLLHGVYRIYLNNHQQNE